MKFTKKRIVTVIGSAVCTLALMTGLTACGEKKSRIKTNEKGEILEITTPNNPENGEYDPAGAAAYVYFTYQQYCLEGLIQYDKDGKILPATAKSWEISDDLCTYTFHLREDSKWSDGSDVTSYDFKNTMIRALNPDKGSWYVDFLFVIKGASEAFYGDGSLDDFAVQTPDAHTLVITLKEPCAYFLDLCKLPVYMPSNCKYATEEDETWDMTPGKNLCNGPYYFAERKAGEYVVYKKNPYYYDADKVNLLSIKDMYMDDDQAKASAYQTGELNLIIGAPSSLAEKYEGKPDLQFAEIPQTNYILFNINMKPFDDVRVRKAFAEAVKRVDIATVVGISCVPSSTFVGRFYKSKADGTEWGKMQGELLKEDLEEAKKLLAEAGYPNGEGLPPITYTYPAQAYEADVAQVLQQQWQQLGVTVNLESMEYEVYVDERRSGKLQLARHQWYADYNDPTTWLLMYSDGNAQNDVKWYNKEYNDLLSASSKEMDAAKRETELMAAEKILVSDECVICPLFTNNNTNLIDPSLENYYFDVLVYPVFYGMKLKSE
jgi:oligopeptide transport system substrate-binding protein